MEIELKLLLDENDVGSIRRHPLLRQYACGKPHTGQLTSIYFDTPDLYLKQNRTALRVRKVGRRWIQTCKSGGGVAAGLHQRPEWESEVGAAFPNLAALRELISTDSPLSALLSTPGLADRLRPIFTTQFRRTIWLLQLAEGQEVEFSLDQGEVRCGDSCLAICEIELELKSGASEGLFDFALALHQTVPLRVANISKAERGYALHSPQPPAVTRAQALWLSSEVTLEQGFQMVVGNCLAQMQGNEDGVAHGDDSESVHQMRVGLRRLRATLNLFKKIIPTPAEILDQLRWLGGMLGPARDWEVLCVATLANAAKYLPSNAQRNRLRQMALREAGKQRRIAATAIQSERYTRLLLLLGGWLQGQRWRDGRSAEQTAVLLTPLKKFAENKLANLQKKLLRRGRRLKKGGAARQHRVRIAAKKVRYSTEFFESYFPAKRTHAYVDALSRLQDALGISNDGSVAGKLLQQLVLRRPDLAEECDVIIAFLASDRKRNTVEINRLWRKFSALRAPQTTGDER